MSRARAATIAVMQPYFIPYAGYFRLFAAADLFVAYDCVQFPRRGWVHRNMLRGADGVNRWLTLPLLKQDRDVLIHDLRFRDDAAAEIAEQARRFPAAAEVERRDPGLAEQLLRPRGSPADHICAGLSALARTLGLEREMVRSSALDIDPALRGQERILAICEALGATSYVNAPGGRDLYDADAFARRGVRLLFLPPYAGSTDSILQRLGDGPLDSLVDEIRATATPD